MERFFDNNENIIKLIILVLALIAIAFISTTFFHKTKMESSYINKIDIGDNVELVFFGLGDADSSLIRDKEKVILIDTGEVDQGDIIIKNLKELEIDRIDFLILTHPDKDHIGGAHEIINNIKVDRVIQSSFKKGTDLQENLDSLIKEKGIEVTIPKEPLQFNLNNMELTIYPPKKDSYKSDNNYSLLTLIRHGDLNFFYGADAEKIRLEEAMTYNLPKVSLYKVPHHGRTNSQSAQMIEILSPEYAIITSHKAEEKVFQSLKLQGSEIIYTANKSVRFLSNGRELTQP